MKNFDEYTEDLGIDTSFSAELDKLGIANDFNDLLDVYTRNMLSNEQNLYKLSNGLYNVPAYNGERHWEYKSDTVLHVAQMVYKDLLVDKLNKDNLIGDIHDIGFEDTNDEFNNIMQLGKEIGALSESEISNFNNKWKEMLLDAFLNNKEFQNDVDYKDFVYNNMLVVDIKDSNSSIDNKAQTNDEMEI